MDDDYEHNRDQEDYVILYNRLKAYITDEDIQLLAYYVDHNLSPAALGRSTGCSRSTAYKRIQSHIAKIRSNIPDKLLHEIKRIL